MQSGNVMMPGDVLWRARLPVLLDIVGEMGHKLCQTTARKEAAIIIELLLSGSDVLPHVFRLTLIHVVWEMSLRM